MSDSRLRLIQGGSPDKPKRPARSLVPWECRACEADIGVRTRSLVKVRDGAFETAKGTLTGGSYTWVCATCLARGRLTPQTA